jgi:hypothetical protein
MVDYSVIAGVQVDGFSGEPKSARRTLVGLVDGSEVVHSFDEFFLVGDRDDWIWTVVLGKRSNVRPVGPLAQRDPLRVAFVGVHPYHVYSQFLSLSLTRSTWKGR